MKIKSINPANFKTIDEVKVSSKETIAQKVKLAQQAKKAWKNLPTRERVNHLKKVKSILKQNEQEIAEIITKEVGTPITECKDEVAWDWGYFDWFLEHAEEHLSPEVVYEDDGMVHEVWHEPYGVVAAITPWNLPFDLFVWAVIPNLLAGNVVIHKASEECILTGKFLAELMQETNLPEGVFQAVHGNGQQGQQLVEQAIDMIWFTGSYEVGHQLYQQASHKFIKAILELGGSNPTIILKDADVEAALGSLMFKRFSFCGQTCDALKRLIVHESKYDEVVNLLSQKIENLRVGDPQDEATQMGPLVSKKQLELLQAQLQEGLDKGASILAQGEVGATTEGAYHPPTLVGNVTTDMRLWSEEIFGPVLPVITFKDEKEAIHLANGTQYGLGSQIFTQDQTKALELASQLEAGNVDINGVGHFKPSSPFGGYKKSGLGREHGKYGFQELCQIKLVAKPK